MLDLHALPKLRDSLSYVYVEHAVLDRKDSAVEKIDARGKTLIPAAAVCVLMLGPGTSITHAAVKVLAENGCSILWTGQENTRFYAQGLGETRKAYHLLRQAELVSDPVKRGRVVLRMYLMRFGEKLPNGLTLPEIRGYEGVRVRDAYACAARQYGVVWNGRNYDRGNWGAADPVNRSLSAANALLNGLCHAAIVSGGYSTALGFVHTGKQLSFVYDVADLYKVDVTLPLAFETAAQHPDAPEKHVREACRQRFHEIKLLDRILPDLDDLMEIRPEENSPYDLESDPAAPEPLWEELEAK